MSTCADKITRVRGHDDPKTLQRIEKKLVTTFKYQEGVT